MHYLYGDSSKSPFSSNFLEFLRDAIDFSVYLIGADQRIAATQARVVEWRSKTDAQIQELEVLRRAAVGAIASTPQGGPESPVSECARRMTAVCDQTAADAVNSVQTRLAREIAQAQAEEDAERNACCDALLALLMPHLPPDASIVVLLALRDASGYTARLDGLSDGTSLKWSWELAFPDGHPFRQVMRVQDLMPRFELNAPDVTGWIKKEVKVRPQHLDRLVLTEATIEGAKIWLRLRSEPGSEIGFDLVSDARTGGVSATRLVVGEDAAAAGPFEVDAEDAPKLIELCRSVQARLADAMAPRLVKATYDGNDFRDLPKFFPVVEQLVRNLSPLVREIALHSLEPDELVLRRQLADDRREEIYVSKTTLRSKYEGLPAELRAVFEPLALEVALSRSIMPAPPPEPGTTSRSELAPSKPPPPPPKPKVAVAPPPPRVPEITPSVAATSSAGESKSASETPELGIGPPSAKSWERWTAAAIDRNEALTGTLKRILELAKAGRQQAAHEQCAALLEDDSFTTVSADEQRRALKLLLLLATPAPASETRTRALHAGCDRSRALVELHSDPADYELYGLCQVALEQSDAAADTFRKGLELERARNPDSDLSVRLARHAAGL